MDRSTISFTVAKAKDHPSEFAGRMASRQGRETVQGHVYFRLAYNLSVAERSKDLLASRFLFIVVQISEADYHRSENKQDV